MDGLTTACVPNRATPSSLSGYAHVTQENRQLNEGAEVAAVVESSAAAEHSGVR